MASCPAWSGRAGAGTPCARTARGVMLAHGTAIPSGIWGDTAHGDPGSVLPLAAPLPIAGPVSFLAVVGMGRDTYMNGGEG